ncbi:MAG: uroporphyrinogen-III synthase [Nevskiaceae bacterium]
MSGRLAGVRVLVTRPAHQAENLCRMLEAEGGAVVRLPLLAIEPGTQIAEARRRLAGGHDLWIFTSANAVRHAAPLATGAWPARLAAVGPATAAAIAVAGHAAAATPLEGASSEALLALPELRALGGARVLLVTGEGGRRTLEQELSARGATVERAEVYRRVPLPYAPDAVAAALRGIDVIVITSGESLDHIVRMTPEATRASLFKKALVVPAARVVEKARELGFLQPPRLAEPMSDAALCAACAPT